MDRMATEGVCEEVMFEPKPTGGEAAGKESQSKRKSKWEESGVGTELTSWMGAGVG